ncbi:MAG: glycosyltransferase family 2 protein [Corynebacterium sp.]|nr:glycosyltransferase family 2 protein [Corynebacterium sp.]
MSSIPALPIITVTYNPGHHIDDLIASVGRAYSGPTRIILVDNGSTDGAPQRAAKAYENVDLVLSAGDVAANIGYGSAMNVGVKYCTILPQGAVDQEKFILVNPDVEFSEGSIDELVAALNDNPKAGTLGPAIIDSHIGRYPSARAIPTLSNGIGHALLGKIWKTNPWTRNYHANTDMDSRHTAGWLSGSCLLVRREAFEKIGGFDERYFMYMEDVDLGDRMGRAGYENLYVPEAVVNHDQGHAANAVPVAMLRAHHESAYRFQADRLNHFWQLPIRFILRVGLGLRCSILIRNAKKGN